MKQLFKKPSYYLISSAMDGNEKAIEKLLAFYDPYISKCCLRSLYDEYGNVCHIAAIGVSAYMKRDVWHLHPVNIIVSADHVIESMLPMHCHKWHSIIIIE